MLEVEIVYSFIAFALCMSEWNERESEWVVSKLVYVYISTCIYNPCVYCYAYCPRGCRKKQIRDIIPIFPWGTSSVSFHDLWRYPINRVDIHTHTFTIGHSSKKKKFLCIYLITTHTHTHIHLYLIKIFFYLQLWERIYRKFDVNSSWFFRYL